MNIQVNINLCRVCMKSETGTSMLSDEGLQTKFEFVTHLRVKKDDNLPAILCEKCILSLNLSNKFIRSAQETEKNLKKFLAKISNDFKLVTKTSPNKNEANEEIDGMLELLSDTEVLQQQNSSKMSTENTTKNDIDKSKSKLENSSKKCTKDASKSTLNEESGLLQRTSSNEDEIDDDDDDDEICNTYDGNEQTLDSNVEAQYIEFKDDNSQMMEYNSLDDILESEEEIFQLNNVSKKEKNNKDDYLEDYEQLLEDETSNVDVIYEDNSVFQTESVEETSDSAIVVKTIVVKVESPNKNCRQNQSVISPKTMSDEQTSDATQKWSPRGGWMRKFTSSVAENTRFYCSKCNRDFSTRTNLTRHMQLHEGKRPYQCNICFKGFSQNGTLKQHMYIHTGEKPHVCSVCNRGFTQAKSLVFHMRRHTGDKPHQCDYCGSLFRQKDALKVHIFKHHTDVGERTFSCKICNKEMGGQELRSHMKKHLNNHKTITIETNDIVQMADEADILGDPIYLAEDAPFDVDDSTHVIDIMATSTTEPSRAKKYQCRTCFKCFAIKKNLIRHISFHDLPASSLHQCQSCDLVFDTIYALKVHRVREHKETDINLNECDECQIQFQNAKELSTHMQSTVHTFTCSLCPDLTFATKKHLNDHYLEHNIDEIEEDE